VRSPARPSSSKGSAKPPRQIRFLDVVIGLLDERKIDRGIVMKRKPQPAEM
jgi:hypothetical protein